MKQVIDAALLWLATDQSPDDMVLNRRFGNVLDQLGSQLSEMEFSGIKIAYNLLSGKKYCILTEQPDRAAWAKRLAAEVGGQILECHQEGRWLRLVLGPAAKH